jgi:hypothetical protein
MKRRELLLSLGGAMTAGRRFDARCLLMYYI